MDFWGAVMEKLRTHMRTTRPGLGFGKRRSQGGDECKQQRDVEFHFHKAALCAGSTCPTLSRRSPQGAGFKKGERGTSAQSGNPYHLSSMRGGLSPCHVISLVFMLRGNLFATYGCSDIILSCLTRKAYWSMVTSMRLLRGIPPPWPARVSTRMRMGLGPACAA